MIDYSLDHVHLASVDPFAAAEWFADNFGAKVVDPWTDPKGIGHVIVRLNDGNIFLKSRAETPTVKSNATQAYGIEHIALLTTDLDAAVPELRGKGVTIVEDISPTLLPGVRHAFLRGPDDILIELIERKPA